MEYFVNVYKTRFQDQYTVPYETKAEAASDHAEVKRIHLYIHTIHVVGNQATIIDLGREV